METKDLFAEFASVTAEEWLKRIREELAKNAPALSEQPNAYSHSDLPNGELAAPLGRHPESEEGWMIREDLEVTDAKVANQLALTLLNEGVSSIGFRLSAPVDLRLLLNNFYLDALPLQWQIEYDPRIFLKAFFGLLVERGYEKEAIKGCLGLDPIGQLAATGKWKNNEKDDLQEITACTGLTSDLLPHYRILDIRADHYHSAGASAAQELACALAHANEYFAYCTDQGLDAAGVAKQMQFTMAVGTDYFPEIAKFRALRILWPQLLAGYEAIALPCFIHAISSHWNMTTYDPYNNLLRTTTEAMSAVIGGCDSMRILPFDAAYKTPSVLSARMARNIQLLIREEAYLDKVTDPGAGAYTIEVMTEQLASEAWLLFQKIEAAGGFLTCLKNGEIQATIEETAQEKIKRIRNGEIIALGVNKHPNPTEKMKGQVEKKDHDLRQSTGQLVIKPLKMTRATEILEKERLSGE